MASGIVLMFIGACFMLAWSLYAPEEPTWANALALIACGAGFSVCVVVGLGRVLL